MRWIFLLTALFVAACTAPAPEPATGGIEFVNSSPAPDVVNQLTVEDYKPEPAPMPFGNGSFGSWHLHERLRVGAPPEPFYEWKPDKDAFVVPKEIKGKYSFLGYVGAFQDKQDGSGFAVLVNPVEGVIPDLGSELTTLDHSGDQIGTLKLIRVYMASKEPSKPEQLGCISVPPFPQNKLAKGHWVIAR